MQNKPFHFNRKPLVVGISIAMLGLSNVALSADTISGDIYTVGATGLGLNATTNNTQNIVHSDPNNAYANGATYDNSASAATAVNSTSPNTNITGNTINNTGVATTPNATPAGIDLNATNTQSATATAHAVARDDKRDYDRWNNGNGNGGWWDYWGTANATAGSSASATANANSQANISGNVVNNHGIIDSSVSNTIGIRLKSASNASASAFADSDTAVYAEAHWRSTQASAAATTAANAHATSIINGNTINNTGTVKAGTTGIQLLSTSDAAILTRNRVVSQRVEAHYQHNDNYWWAGWGSYSDSTQGEYSATSKVTGNTLNNSGTVTANQGAGIVLRSEAGRNSLSNMTQSMVDYSILANPTWAYDKYNLNTGITSTAETSGNFITNTGTIAANGGTGSDGIQLSAIAKGSINTELVSSNTISNTGHIYAMDNGINLFARELDSNGAPVIASANAAVKSNTINNIYGGRIVANNIGININDNSGAAIAGTVRGNTITNSGLIVADHGMSLDGTNLTKSNQADFNPDITAAGNTDIAAIRIQGDAGNGGSNTINLNAPAYLAGAIQASNGNGNNSNTTVNLTSGLSHSNRWAIQNDRGYGAAQINTSGPLPWFVNTTNQLDVNGVRNDIYATIDPTALAAAPNQLAEISGAAANLLTTNMTKDFGAADRVWFTGQGGVMDRSSNNTTTMRQSDNMYSVGIGYDTTVANNYRVGVMAGYTETNLKTGSLYSDLYANSYDNTANGGFIGGNVFTKYHGFDIDGNVSVGMQDHKDKRFVNDNTQWWGISYADSNYNSVWVSPGIKVAYPFNVYQDYVLSPFVQSNYTYQSIDSHTEKGSNSNASYANRNISIVESRVGTELSKKFDIAKVSVGGGYLNRSLIGGSGVNVTMIGDTHNVESFYDNIQAGFAKVNASVDVHKNVELGLGGSYMHGSGLSGGFGNATVKVKFD